MDKYEPFYNKLREQGLRVTEPRKAIVNVLTGRHLTFQEIKQELEKKRHVNLASLYNNIDFLLKHEAIVEIHINGKTYYDLAIEELSHDANSYIHTSCNMSNAIIEVMDDSIIELIKAHPRFKHFKIDKISINVEGKCTDEDHHICRLGDTLCFLNELRN